MMELAPLGNLKEYLRAERIVMDRRFAGWIMRQALNGLSHLHEQNILHGDFKPENLFVFPGTFPVIKLGDLGSAVDLKTRKVTHCITTPQYAAPEMLEVEFEKETSITIAADIYSAGVVFAELVGIAHPFHPFDDPQHMPPAKRFAYLWEQRPLEVQVKGVAMALTKHATDFLEHSTSLEPTMRQPIKYLKCHPITWLSKGGVTPKKWIHPDGQNAACRVAAFQANLLNGNEKQSLRDEILQLKGQVEKWKRHADPAVRMNEQAEATAGLHSRIAELLLTISTLEEHIQESEQEMAAYRSSISELQAKLNVCNDSIHCHHLIFV